MRHRSSTWWLLPVVGILTALVVLVLAIRSLPAHEADDDCDCPRWYTAKRDAGEMGYGVTWGPRANRQSIVVWGTGADAEIRFESYGPPFDSLSMRGPTVQVSEFPPAAVALLRRQLAEP